MRRELKAIADRLSHDLAGARPVLLPYPYTAGHFRVHTECELPPCEEFSAVRRGSTLFVTITGEGLKNALAEMNVPTRNIQPELSPLHTLLVQIFDKNMIPDQMDCPLLARLTLDLDEDAARCRRVIGQMEPLLRREYAQALRTNRKHSMLPVIAGQIVEYIQRVSE